jgi:hypothetical protein
VPLPPLSHIFNELLLLKEGCADEVIGAGKSNEKKEKLHRSFEGPSHQERKKNRREEQWEETKNDSI